MNIEIRRNDVTGQKDLYLYDKFQASWPASVDDMTVIVPDAIERAIGIGEDRMAMEFRRLLRVTGGYV